VRYLLDTCVALWYFEGSDKIVPAIKKNLTDPENELYLSDVSLLEIVIKYNLGKLRMTKSPSRIIPMLMEKHGIDGLPLDAQGIFKLEKIPLLHRDPFDRLLIAQAVTHRMILVTPDPLIHKYDDAPVYWV